MRKITASILTILSIGLDACESSTNEKTAEQDSGSTTLGDCFSARGLTKALAEKVAVVTGGTLLEIPFQHPDKAG